ncbi:MAG TPA: oxygenase MpaB family protein [Pricia sp.]|nr:oxygenase MpaB family protein [Pricia sp.]
MEYFVEKDSIVRKIWGKGDTILFIFAGASAEFALNKEVDWLYFTGRLPADPLGRLFSTVSYARQIVFSEKEAANRAINSIAAIHSAVEEKRGAKIPDWAYRDVLFMLIDYSIRSFEVLQRKLTFSEKKEVFHVFYRVGRGMKIPGLPQNFEAWKKMRKEHLQQDLAHSKYSKDLYKQYRKHLGTIRYRLLLEAQTLVVPKKVNFLLDLRKFSLLTPLLGTYKLSRTLNLDTLIRETILPSNFMQEIRELDAVPINKCPYSGNKERVSLSEQRKPTTLQD